MYSNFDSRQEIENFDHFHNQNQELHSKKPRVRNIQIVACCLGEFQQNGHTHALIMQRSIHILANVTVKHNSRLYESQIFQTKNC